MVFNRDYEIVWLKTKIIPKLVKEQKIIGNIQENDFEHFEITNIEIKLLGSEVAFMLTTCYRAVIKYNFKGAEKAIHLFVKKTPELPQETFDAINFKALFTNEIIAYEKLMPALQEFSRNDLKIAKFYYGDLQKNSAIVVIEDFSHRGWCAPRQMVNLSLEHILLGVKYLAEFHAIGFAWRQLKPETFHEFTKGLMEPRYESAVHPTWACILRESKKRALKATRKHEPTVDESFLENFNNLLGDTHHYSKERVKPREPLTTLCHGDYLRNNVAFQYDAAGQPVDVMMFDLQTLRVSSPMVDLTIYLSLSSYAEVRYKHFSDIFQLYSDTLSRTYEKLVPGAVPEHFSYNILLKEYIKFLPYSISICAAFLMSLVAPNTITPEEMLTAERTEDDTIHETATKGGEEVDRELAHQIKELYELDLAQGGNVYKDF